MAGGQEGTLADFNQRQGERHPREGSRVEVGGAHCLLHPPSALHPGLDCSKPGLLPAPTALSPLHTLCPPNTSYAPSIIYQIPRFPKIYHTAHPLTSSCPGT